MASEAFRIGRLYVIMLSAIALLALSGQFVIQQTLSNQRRDGAAINVAGRQRMLSERLIKHALSLNQILGQRPLPTLAAERQRSAISQTMATLVESHRSLRHGDGELKLRAPKDAAIVGLMDELRPLIDTLQGETNELLDSVDAFMVHHQSDAKAASLSLLTMQQSLKSLTETQAEFLPQMDDLVGRMSGVSEAKVRRSQRFEFGFLVLTLLALFIEGWFVFRPSVTKIRTHIAQLKQREAQLLESERKSRDLVRYSAGPILCLEPSTSRILDLNPAAASAIGDDATRLLHRRFSTLLCDEVSTRQFHASMDQLEIQSQSESRISLHGGNDQIRHWLVRLIRYEAGEGDAFVLMSGYDITEQVDRENLLLEENRRDDMTGLLNRGEFDRNLSMLTTIHQNRGTPFALAMVDVDFFKSINDRFGHRVGDLVLQQLANIVQQSCRQADLVCRYGGEEIAILFPSIRCDDALPIANRIRETLKRTPIQWRDPQSPLGQDDERATADEEDVVHATVSIGLAAAPNHGMTPTALISAADAALYAAKSQGRDRVVIATDLPVMEMPLNEGLQTLRDTCDVVEEARAFLDSPAAVQRSESQSTEPIA